MRAVPAFVMKVCALSLTQKKRVLSAVWKYLQVDEEIRDEHHARGLRGREMAAFALIKIFMEHPAAFLLFPVGLAVLIVTLAMRMF